MGVKDFDVPHLFSQGLLSYSCPVCVLPKVSSADGAVAKAWCSSEAQCTSMQVCACAVPHAKHLLMVA